MSVSVLAQVSCESPFGKHFQARTKLAVRAQLTLKSTQESGFSDV